MKTILSLFPLRLILTCVVTGVVVTFLFSLIPVPDSCVPHYDIPFYVANP